MWESVNLTVTIFVGTALLNKCNGDFENFEIGTIRRFEVRCDDVSGVNLPDNVSYKVSVQRATRLTET